MRAHEIINELFSPSFKPTQTENWRNVYDNASHKQFSFDIDNNNYIVSLDAMPGIGHEILRVEFGLKKPGEIMQWDIAKTGSSARVMELVAYSIRRALADGATKGLFFTAKEPSRQKLYTVLAKTIAANTGWVMREDLARWLNTSQEYPYLILSQSFADRLERAKEEQGDVALQPALLRQPDTFGALPIRMD